MERQRWSPQDVKSHLGADQSGTADPVRAIHGNVSQVNQKLDIRKYSVMNLTQTVGWRTLRKGRNSRNHLKRTQGQITQAGLTLCPRCVFSSLPSLLQTFSTSSGTSSAPSPCITHSCLETINMSTNENKKDGKTPLLTLTPESARPDGPSSERLMGELGMKVKWGQILPPW